MTEQPETTMLSTVSDVPSTGDDEYDAAIFRAEQEVCPGGKSLADMGLVDWYVKVMAELDLDAKLAEAEYVELRKRLEELQEYRRRRMNQAYASQMAVAYHFEERVTTAVKDALVQKNTKKDGTLRATQVKSLTLAMGKTGFRMKPLKVEIVDEIEAIDWAAINLPLAIKQTIRKSLVSDYVKQAGGNVELPGVKVTGGHDEFFPVAKPLKTKSKPGMLVMVDGELVDRETGEVVNG